METIDRKPAVAGQFYPDSPNKLQQDLTKLFSEAVPKQSQHVRAIISPHAGYVFSGKVAASTLHQIDTRKS
jgi:MEMO1 family protein